MRLLTIVLFLISVLGCGSLLETGIDYPEACGYYDAAYLGWTATSAAASGLAAATSTASAMTDALSDNQDATIALGASGAVLGVLATVAGLLAGEYADRLVQDCGAPAAGAGTSSTSGSALGP